MKIWFKYLLAIVVGIVAGIFIPQNTIFNTITEITINISGYILGFMLFFSAVIAAFELHEEKKVIKTLARTILYSVFLIILFTFIGLVAALIIPPKRLPLAADIVANMTTLPNFSTLLQSLFPKSALETLLSTNFLLPATIFACLLGMSCSFDKILTKPVVVLFDSLSQIFWRINSYIVEFIPIPLIIIAATRTKDLIAIPRHDVYFSLLATIACAALVIIFIILPLLLLIFDRKTNPYVTLFALVAPALLALVTGNLRPQIGISAKHLKEDLGVRRRSGAVSLPFALSFGRAGSAMVITTSFIAILSSYSYKGLNNEIILWIIVSVPLISLILGSIPEAGPIVALTSLCNQYGKGFESGYTILIPIALPLAMIAICVDTITAACVVYLTAARSGNSRIKDTRHFI